MNSQLRLQFQPHRYPGRLIVFSGSDGSGKSTLTQFAINTAKAMGHRTVEVDLLDDAIRKLQEFRDYAHDPITAVQRVDLLALSLVCAGSRLKNVRKSVFPHLASGAWVFCDRYVFTIWAEYLASTTTENVCDEEVLRKVLEAFPQPDLGFLPYANAELCIERVRQRENEKGKILDYARYHRLIYAYRSVAVQNNLIEVCTERSQSECEEIVRQTLLQKSQEDPAVGPVSEVKPKDKNAEY